MDIEELMQRCRGANARVYIREAVDCYRIGAYRASVITTWIAVVYDLVDKLRELGIQGDAAAAAHAAEFDRVQKENDLDAALKFERDVIDIAKDQFELISGQEAMDLNRLFQDRNRCGHPNLRRENEIYSPTPELARLHLRSAVEHVLARPPVQGKAALNAVWFSVESDSFPPTTAGAKTVLSATPICRAKRNLIREFASGLITSLLKEDLTKKQHAQRTSALTALKQLHSQEVEQLLADRFDGFVFALSDQNLTKAIKLVHSVADLQPLLREATLVRLNTYVVALPTASVEFLPAALTIPVLNASARTRLNACTEPELLGIAAKIEFNPTSPFIDRCVAIYGGAHNFNHANILAVALVGPVLAYASKDQLKSILGCADNSQVRFSNRFPEVIKSTVAGTELTPEEGRAVLIAKGFQELADQHLPLPQ